MNSNLVTVDASSWVAGSTYQVVLRWDQDNPLDGTNYASISVNDSHTFGRNLAFSTNSVAGNQYLGSKNDGSFAANAIIEGLTVYRRPLFDGTYGIDIGNGDEINLIYNSGTGKDPVLVTGSWDVVFALPTNGSTGTLTTGTGNAWSHPHSSNLLYTSTTNTGGFMMNGTYTNDGWTNEGTPTTVTALATSEKIFAGGYKTTSDAANEGMYRDITTSAGSDYVIRALANSDGTSIPKIVFYDQTNGAEIGSMTGTTASTRTAPNVFVFTGEAPTGCSTIRVKLVNTQTSGTAHWHQVEVLPNQVNGPSMETGSGTPWSPTGFVISGGIAGEAEQELVDVNSGSSAWQINGMSTYGKNGYYDLNTTFSTGSFINVGFAAKGAQDAEFGFHECPSPYRNMVAKSTGGSTWKNFFNTVIMPTPCGEGSFLNLVSVTIGIVDDLYSFQVPNVSLTVTPATSANSIESNKIRIDGRDNYTHTYPGITTSAGTYTFDYTPRHSAGDVAKFGEATPYIAQFYGDADDNIKLFWSAANTVKLEYQMNGGTVTSGTWDATNAISAGTNYRLVVSYTGSGNMTLSVDGVNKITLSSIPAAFGSAPATAYWGSDQAGTQQGDATFLPQFTTYSANTTAPYYKFSSKSAKVGNSIAPEPRGYVTSINPGNTNTHTLSAYVYDGTTGNIGGTVSATVAKLVFNGAVVTPTAYTDMGGGWWRLSYSAATANAAGNYGVQALVGKTIYVDGVQLEEKVYATTYTDGSLGTGYAWDTPASPNNSASTRNSSSLTYSNSNNLNTSQWGLSFWLNTLNLDSSQNYTIWNAGGNIALKASINSLQLQRCGGGITAVNWSLTSKSWHHIVVTWDGTTLRVYDNASAPGSFNPSNVTYGTNMNIGNGSWCGSQSYEKNLSFSDFRIFNSALTSTEVASLYYSGLGSHEMQTDFTEQFSGQEGPVAFWKFDEGYGEIAYDSSNQGNNASISGATWSDDEFGSAPDGKSLQFDGTNDYVTKTYNNDIELDPGILPFTVSTWFKAPSTVSAQQTIISRYSGNGYKLYMNASGQICFGVDDDSTWGPDDAACSTGSFADSQWHFITAVKETDSINVYVDGMKMVTTTLTATGGLSGSNTTFYVGIDSDGSSNPWKGFIDEVRVYTYALNTAQIMAEYAARGSVKGISAGFIGEGAEGALGQGLVGYWKMDEASWNGTAGEVLDSSGNSNNGVSVGGTSTSTGKYAKGGVFDGSDDYLNMSNPAELNNLSSSKMTVAFWAKKTTDAYFFSKDGGGTEGWIIGTSGSNLSFNGRLQSGSYVPTTTNDNRFTTGVWHHVALILDGINSTPKFYIDGVESTYSTNTVISDSFVDDSSYNLQMGWRGWGSYWSGSLDEARIYNRALSPAEVQALYNWAPKPRVHLKMDEGGGGTANDSSGNNRPGTLNNNATWDIGKFGQGIKLDGTGDNISVPSF